MFRVVTFLSVLTGYGHVVIFVFIEFVKMVLEIIIRITQKVDGGMSVTTALPRSQSRTSAVRVQMSQLVSVTYSKY